MSNDVSAPGASHSPGLLENGGPLIAAAAWLSSYIVPDVHWQLRRATRGFTSILDVGCGAGTSPFRFIPVAAGQRRTGIDRFAPAVDRSRVAGIHNDYLVDDILSAHFERRFECVVALDVVEHFTREDGFRFLDRLEALATRRVIVFTPNGFVPQEPFDGNEFQRHLSGWSVDDFAARGYRVTGAMGWKPLRGEYALPTLKPTIVGTAVSLLTQYATFARPRSAYHLFAVKDIRQPNN